VRVKRFAAPRERSGFQFVCNDCGSLSIKMVDTLTASGATLVHRGRCNAVRGTLAGCTTWRGAANVFEF
jgi:hypothetical protein